MTSLLRRTGATPLDVFDRMDRFFDDWVRSLPARLPFPLEVAAPATAGAEAMLIRVDEFLDGDTRVVRAEMPGIDPDRDVELSVADGMLQIAAERRTEERTEEKGYLRQEMRYGRFSRTLPVPEGVAADQITATYKDGILEVRIPQPAAPAPAEPTKIAISKS